MAGTSEASFEWDDEKDRANRDKHGVGFEPAQRAFLDPNRRIEVDEAHSTKEPRPFGLGAEAIPLCHKLALRALAPGERVRKYGEVIGEMTSAVAQGGLVHIHNMASCRARRAEGERRHAG